jgi:acetylornithine deacetylase/succinyl-diaminopimelate desuccinylase-like protein
MKKPTPIPALQLARLLSGMKDETGKIKSEGFCGSESGDRSLMEAIMYPSLNVNGIRSGWIGKQARTIIPAAATASIDIRLVKGNDPADMVQKVIDHVRGQGYHVVGEEPDQAVRLRFPFIVRVAGRRDLCRRHAHGRWAIALAVSRQPPVAKFSF